MIALKNIRWRLLIARAALVLVSTLLAIGLVELALRLTREPGRFYPFYPNNVKVIYPAPEIVRGVSGPAYFSTNSLGCRGPEMGDEKHRLLVMGGSTAACIVLDDTEHWPQLIMDNVNAHFGDKKYLWVTNAGMDGRNSRHHLMYAKYLVPKVPNLDHVLVYCGFNDMNMWLFKPDFDPNFLERRENVEKTMADCFLLSNYTPEDYPWFKHLEIWKRASVLKAAYKSRRMAQRRDEQVIVEDERLQWMKEARERRHKRNITTVDSKKMATFQSSLDAYAKNLTEIIQYVRKAGSEPIFMAQVMEFDEMTEEERKEWWLGAMDGGETYAELSQLQEFVRKYNQRMEEVAKANDVLFIPLPKLVEDKGDIFYDGIHFHEKGSREVAEVVSDFLIKNVYEKPAPTQAATKAASL
jgi:lysophospholipase L1-like esterase